MKKITNILLSLIISVAILSVCYADWQTDLQTALNEGKTRLDLDHQKIDNAGIRIIAAALVSPNCKIAKLDLSGNNLDNEGAKIIVQAIAKRGCKLNKLNLSNNNINDAGAEFIIEALTAPDCQLPKFSLYLSDNPITPNGAQLIANAFALLEQNRRLALLPEILQPQYNHPRFQVDFIDKPLIEFKNLIFDKSLRIQNINLDEDDITDICVLQSLDKLTIINCGLEEVPVFPRDYSASIINLSNNKFNPNSKDYSIRLKNLFLLPNLRNLNLCNCGITSILPFSSEEKQHCCLEVLTIANNALLPHIAQMLAELPLLEVADFGSCKLKKAPEFVSNKLTMLKLDYNDLNERGDELKWLFEHPTLTKLILDSCNITCIEFEPKQCHLKQLSLKGNKLDQETVVRLGNSATIEVLVLQECGLEHDAVQAFASALYNMQQLKQPVKLWRLNLSINNLENANLKQLFQIESLRVLGLSECEITSLAEFDLTKSQIENLNMAKNPLDHDSIMKLTQMPNLTQLEIHGLTIMPEITPEMELEMTPRIIAKMLLKMTPKMISEMMPGMTIEEISKMTPEMISEITSKMTPEMKLEMKLEMNSEVISKITQPMFSMPKLEVLNINGCEIPSLGNFEPKSCKIKQLWVAGNQLDDASYAKIAQMPNLTKLNIRKCNANKESLAHVFSIKNLEYLEIGELEFRDNNLKKGGRNIQEVSLGTLNQYNNQERIAEFSWLPNLYNLNGIPYEHTDQMKRASRIDERDLYIMLNKPNNKDVVELLKSNPNAIYIVVDDMIYVIENGTLRKIGEGAWLKKITRNIEPNNDTPLHLSDKEEIIIASNRNYYTQDTYQQQREEFYHNFNQLKTMRDINEQQKEQRLEKLNSANAKIENMSKNTLNIFENGGQ